MARKIEVAAGHRGVALDDGLVVDAGNQVIVSDEQFALLAGLVDDGILLDLGATTESLTPGSDSRFTRDEIKSMVAESIRTGTGVVHEAVNEEIGTSLKPMSMLYVPEHRRTGPVSTDPPTVVTGAAQDASLNQAYTITGNVLPAIWPVDAYGDMRINNNTWLATTSQSNTATVTTLRMTTDAPKVALFTYGSPFYADLYIDGKPFANNPIVLANTAGFGAYGLTTLTFATAKPRLIEWRSLAGLVACYVARPYRIWKPPSDPNPKVAVVGDSYVAPTVMQDAAAGVVAAGAYLRGMYQRMEAHLGITSLVTDGIGGTGYINPGGAGRPYGHDDRLAWLARVQPEVLVVHGGGANDLYAGSTVQAVTAAAVAYFTEVRALLPQTRLVFVEGFSPPSFPFNANFRTIRENVQAALVAGGVEAYYLDVATTHPPLNGTGYVTAANATGNSDIYVGSDQAHPTVRGHEYLRRWLAPKIAKVLADRGPLRNQLI